MSYLITSPKTTFKGRRRAERLWAKSTHPVPAVAGAAAWVGSIQQFFGPSNIIMATLLGAAGTASLSLSGWYYGRFVRRRQMKFVPYTGTEYATMKEWSNMLEKIFSIEEELFNYVESLDPDNFAFPAARDAWRAVSEVQWDALQLYNKMVPYLTNVRPTTEEILKDELKKISLWRDQAEQISNNVLHLGIRSETFVDTADKDHLDVLARELSSMCETLDELSHQSARQLAMTSADDQYKDRYVAGRSHTDGM